MWKVRGRLVYSADYDKNSGSVTTRDWRKDDDKEDVSSKGGGRMVLP